MKHLLIVYHSQSGKTGAMARAAYRGATAAGIEGVQTRMLRAAQAGVRDLLWAEALLLGTPENFGYMSGAMKDFLDRTYYPCEGRLEGIPFAVFISAGNDGTGALGALRRIARGYSLKEAQEPVICRGELTEEALASCEELGMAFAAGLEIGVY